MYRLWLLLVLVSLTFLTANTFDGTVINFGEQLSNLQRNYPRHHFPVRSQRAHIPIKDIIPF
ncbi:hypothetical protein KIN20_035158 [Parelaphostrongylus tenuis]|uniref:Uncharacterized protein n=1 Tax=Parelaphostrongylus tenuis TaxID=148309 RepID=A0AAD5RDS9_PARTN|nr:hypothetical protein KIN20_035158 [Parelaphostrongylus tenuis]